MVDAISAVNDKVEALHPQVYAAYAAAKAARAAGEAGAEEAQAAYDAARRSAGETLALWASYGCAGRTRPDDASRQLAIRHLEKSLEGE